MVSIGLSTLNFICAINSYTLLSVYLVLMKEMGLVAKKNQGSPTWEVKRVFKAISLDLQKCSLPRHHIAKLPNPFNLKLLNSQVHQVD